MPSTEIQVFIYPTTGAEVRLAKIDDKGVPWFVAKDVCDVLSISQTHRALAGLDEDEKGRHTMTTLGGPQELSIISEPGLWGLVLLSRKPEAQRMKRWLKHEVLPSIRKTGQYGAQPDVGALITVVTELVHEIRQDRQQRQLNDDERRVLMRKGKRLHGSSEAAWRLICQTFDYPLSSRQFSTVKVDQLPAVNRILEQSQAAIPQAAASTVAKKVATSVPWNQQITVGNLAKTSFKKGRPYTLQQLASKLNHSFNVRTIDASVVETLIDEMGVRNDPWSKVNKLMEEVWDEDAYDWIWKGYQNRSAQSLGKSMGFQN